MDPKYLFVSEGDFYAPIIIWRSVTGSRGKDIRESLFKGKRVSLGLLGGSTYQLVLDFHSDVYQFFTMFTPTFFGRWSKFDEVFLYMGWKLKAPTSIYNRPLGAYIEFLLSRSSELDIFVSLRWSYWDAWRNFVDQYGSMVCQEILPNLWRYVPNCHKWRFVIDVFFY